MGFRSQLSDEDIVQIADLRDVAMATNFGTTLAANGLVREITTLGFRIKDGSLSVNPFVCWSLSLWIRTLRRSELLRAGDCQVGN